MEGRQPVWFCRPPDELHACFLRCAAALFVIATEARSHNVVPAFLSAKRYWYYVIEREIFGWKLLTAILARVIVPRVYICARKLHTVVILHPDVFQQANDGGEFDGESNRMDLLVILFDHF